jgi:tetratricopeptide (TPR) repeat protein
LFIERTRSLVTDFDAAQHLEDVEEICRRLDGIALAIELAAARMASLTASDIRSRLDDRFRLLTGRRRGLERHQTLRNAVQWSYELLGPEQRTVLDRCSVFAGGFDLSAAAHICSDRFDEYETLDFLDTLVHKSLLVADRSRESMRYSMLETIRQFAEEQLAHAGDLETITNRHTDYYATVSAEMAALWTSPRQVEVHRWVETNFANLRAAFGCARANSDFDRAASIAVNVAFIALCLNLSEASSWAEELLADMPDVAHPKALGVLIAAGLCVYGGRTEEGIAYAERALPLLDDPHYEPVPDGGTHGWAALPLLIGGRIDDFIRLTRLQIELGDPFVHARSSLTWVLGNLGRADEVEEYAECLIEDAEATGRPATVVFALEAWASAHVTDQPEAALAARRRALGVADDALNPFIGSIVLRELGYQEALHGNPTNASARFAAAINLFRRAGDAPNLLATFGRLALCLADRGAMEPAALLAAATIDNPAVASLVPELPSLHQRLQVVLGPSAFDAIAARASAMDRVEVAAYAIEQLSLLHHRSSLGAQQVAAGIERDAE